MLVGPSPLVKQVMFKFSIVHSRKATRQLEQHHHLLKQNIWNFTSFHVKYFGGDVVEVHVVANTSLAELGSVEIR